MIHGYCHFSLVWWFYFWKLKKHFGPIYTVNLGSPLKSIPDYAKKVEKILPLEESWTLVGHSMGGLVSTYLAIHSEYKDRIIKIITMASPFHGTKIAHLGFGKCARQMETGSSFIKKLEQEKKKLSLPIYYLATKQDQIAIPYETALPEKDPSKEKVLEGVGHVGLLLSDEALRQVKSWITE